MVRNSLLAFTDFNQQFEIHTNASNFQLESVISQEVKTIYFYSRELKNPKRYTVTENELLSIIVERNDIFSLKWRYYGPKQDILEYWGTLIYFLLSYYILSMIKVIGLK